MNAEWEVDERIADWFAWPEELKADNQGGIAACGSVAVLDEAGNPVLDDEGQIITEPNPRWARLFVFREIGGRRAFALVDVSRNLFEQAGLASYIASHFDRKFARLTRQPTPTEEESVYAERTKLGEDVP